MSNNSLRDIQTDKSRQTDSPEVTVSFQSQRKSRDNALANANAVINKSPSPLTATFTRWEKRFPLFLYSLWKKNRCTFPVYYYSLKFIDCQKRQHKWQEKGGGQVRQFAKGRMREKARFLSGLERALEMGRDREMEGEEQEEEEKNRGQEKRGGFYSKWLGQSSESAGERRERCYGRRDKWKTIDVAESCGRESLGEEEGGSDIGYKVDICKKRHLWGPKRSLSRMN